MQLLTKASYTNEVSQREKDNLQLSYEAACESMVLLENDGTLPLKTKKVALYGPGATKTVKGGTGSGEVNERHAVTIREGLKNRGFEIASEQWLNDYDAAFEAGEKAHQEEKRKRLSIFKRSAIMEMIFDDFRFPVGREITETDVAESGADTCVYVLARQAGEGGDRKLEPGDYYLTDEERYAIQFCASHYVRFVLVINSGAPIDVSFKDEIEGINAIVYICQPGSEGGNALADLLSGAVTPSGKLADTWVKQYSDIPFSDEYSHLNGNLEQEFYREGIYVGYRYFDSFGVEPAYPFGYGKSYTEFDIRLTDVQINGRELAANVQVVNTGSVYAGREVVQLYISCPPKGLKKEYQALAAFGKTGLLLPGASQTLTLQVDLRDLASYRCTDCSYVLEAGEYVLRVGNSSRNTFVGAVAVIEREIIVSQHIAVCPLQQPMEELAAPESVIEEVSAELPRLVVDADAFETVAYSYDSAAEKSDEQVDTFLQTLSTKELAEIVVGVGMFGGKTRFTLPGSVGNTTSKFWDRGLSNIALCDGPAGLRIQRRSTVDAKGKVKAVDLVFSAYDMLPSFVKKRMVGNPETEMPLYQYATAFPVETALAQTWNIGLLVRVGAAIGREMKEYGCTFWLAPAVNIHRNPLCGRHFEYFSEDPRLAGKMAAALTQGVQQEPGLYVTVKHFACNNQEDNRNFVSSEVGERALREIYLKPFEISVREGRAKGIMTSYNKVNGVYAPNSHDLCTKILRHEWGFDGVVMTDWFSTGKGKAANDLAMKAGNDLLMPGTAANKKEILNGIRSGRIAEEDLRRCCGNVIKAIMNSATQKEYIGSK